MNAFWDEFRDHAEIIYDLLYSKIRKVEMDSQGIAYLHQYEEGMDLDFDIALVLFESVYNHFHNTGEAGEADAKKYPKAVRLLLYLSLSLS